MIETIEWIACAERLPDEIFLPVRQWDGLYEVSNFGRVRSLPRVTTRRDGTVQTWRGKIMGQTMNSSGYLTVRLSDDANERRSRPLVHRLVCEAFIPNPNNLPFVNHKNARRNDNRLENLEWITQRDNLRHAWSIGTRNRSHLPIKRGEDSQNAKLTAHQVTEIVDLWRSGASSRAIARRYGVGKTQVLRIKDGKSWTWHTGSPAGPRG